VPPERQRQAAIIGGLLLVVGVVLHVAPPKVFDGPPVPPSTPRFDTKPELPPPRPSVQEIPTNDPVRQYAPPTEKCCQYDFRPSRIGWCRPWGSTPRGSDNPAELGSSCYCQDKLGVVVHNCR
jgi:hypothetical protein